MRVPIHACRGHITQPVPESERSRAHHQKVATAARTTHTLAVRILVALLATSTMACSFVGVRGPAQRVSFAPKTPAELDCPEESILPSLDALGGAFAMSAAVAGVFAEQLSEDGEPDGFTKFYAGPLAALSIVYLISAGYGNTRITWCSDAKDRARRGER